MLALSNHLKYLYVGIKDILVAPTVLDERMFLSNQQLETIKLEMSIQEIKV